MKLNQLTKWQDTTNRKDFLLWGYPSCGHHLVQAQYMANHVLEHLVKLHTPPDTLQGA